VGRSGAALVARIRRADEIYHRPLIIAQEQARQSEVTNGVEGARQGRECRSGNTNFPADALTCVSEENFLPTNLPVKRRRLSRGATAVGMMS
jgi:hypothetical protein